MASLPKTYQGSDVPIGSLNLDWYNRMHGILHVNSIGMNPLPSIEETKIALKKINS